MKRLHVHVAVADLDRSVGFYSTLFGAKPVVVKPDYAKWMLEDPRVNFAISHRRHDGGGIEHLGIQVEDEGELAEVYGRLQAADRPVLEEGRTTCCYARSEKSWIADPDGVTWEAFLTHGEATVYGGGPSLAAISDPAADAAADAAAGGTVERPAGTAAPPELAGAAIAAAAPAPAARCCG
jgi:catechol 2,3-dioxygenase-like lactoylglutathione lyase family enzyme